MVFLSNRLKLALLPLIALSLTAAGRDAFTRDDLASLESALQAVEQRIADMEAAQNSAGIDVIAVEDQLIRSAVQIRRREVARETSMQRLIDLNARQSDLQAGLTLDAETLEDVLAIMVSSGRRPPPALIASPGSANSAIRQAVVLQDVTPNILQKISITRDELTSLTHVERAIRRETHRLAALEAVLLEERREIEALAASRREHYLATRGALDTLKHQAAQMAAEANSMREVIARLEANAPTPPSQRVGSGARLTPLGRAHIGAMLRPTEGLVKYRFGEQDSLSQVQRGVTILPPPHAQVVAPIDGEVVFADSYRSFGHMVILRTADDYLLILSGMDETLVAVGQAVRQGIPVGQMPDQTDSALYLELRQRKQSVNPARWMQP